jgi:serine/threonine protein kinase/TolA-binding protein
MSELQSTRFGKYLLLEKLAVGGMAQLYRAKITGIQGFEKLIAIKTILPHLTVENELLDSFIDEAKLAALLHHQNIVQIYDFGSMEGSYFIAMEFLFGKDLRHIFNKSRERRLPMSLELGLYVISRVCSGLDYAHTLQDFQGKPLSIIHRDISPQNIFVTYEGEVKIVDFGIAKAASQSTITQFGMIKGKIAYMSPEQASGHPIDHRSDIFSTGIILYEMVTGKRMFTGADTLQILAKVSRAEFESPEAACSSLSPKICRILSKCLMKDPDQRYQSCGEMLTDIEECLFELSLRPSARGLAHYTKELFHDEIATEGQIMRETLPTEAERPLPPERETKTAAGLQAPGVAAPAPDVKASKTPGRRPLLFAAAGAVIVIAVLVAAFAFRGKSVSTPAREVAVKPAQTSVRPPEGAAPEKAPPAEAKAPEKGPAPDAQAKALQDRAAGVIEKDPKEAKTLLLQAVQLDPASVQGHFQLGLAYMRLKDYGKAIEAYQKAAILDPKLPDTFFNLGYLYAVGKDYSRAEEMYGRTVTLAPSYLDEALFNLGMVQEKQGKRKESIENLEKALSINPKNEMARKLLGKLKQKS